MAIKREKRSPPVSYQIRLRGYEQDKQNLVKTMSHLPAKEFSEKLNAIREKWRI